MKVLLDYNPTTGAVANDSQFIGTCLGLEEYKVPASDKVDTLVSLKEAGFTAEEILEFHRKEII